MQDGISLENLLEESVVGSSESVMGTGGLSKEKTHWVTFVSKRGLDTTEDCFRTVCRK
jgi:hypothetical protein